MTELNEGSPPEGGSPNPSGDPDNKGQKGAEGEEYNKERFDGLMSARQKAEDEKKTAEKKLEKYEKDGKPIEQKVGDDKGNQKEWVNYLRIEIKKAEKEESTERDKMIKGQLTELKESHPDFTEKEILEAAIEYSEDEETPISLLAAAKILQRIKDSGKTKEELAAAEQKKKDEAGGTGGRSAAPAEPGLKPFDPEKDKDKSLQELMTEGKQELGTK